ncbi:hypothetical protein BN6_46720 [Saccharothrix espanaensis DSM 44229]|uniref:Uncharacterized protein n=1 Tax=Saccharothrix espanaensis (strain ATCC 51144 / DSM 44229 / JCM 9112 / NBRC 15066 / NRRL 15764) TaxID=1179773 RepID=K0K0R5_SACES|nr:hypothetical protein BN6_46720 [Saccharothrix espanaensis DSM 44229]
MTGERLTAGAARDPADSSHSRLAVSPSGRYLLSAGRVWHPYGCLAVYDLHRALAEPTTLDSHGDVFGLRGLIQEEVAGACFVDDVVVSTGERGGARGNGPSSPRAGRTARSCGRPGDDRPSRSTTAGGRAVSGRGACGPR